MRLTPACRRRSEAAQPPSIQRGPRRDRQCRSGPCCSRGIAENGRPPARRRGFRGPMAALGERPRRPRASSQLLSAPRGRVERVEATGLQRTAEETAAFRDAAMRIATKAHWQSDKHAACIGRVLQTNKRIWGTPAEFKTAGSLRPVCTSITSSLTAFS